jgi:hypothetical protein
MSSKTASRRTKLVEGAITSAALKHATETEKLVPFGDDVIEVWNSYADRIDQEHGTGFVGCRIVRDNAFTFHFEWPKQRPSVSIKRRNLQQWRTLGLLDDLASKPLLLAKIEAQQQAIEWMADLLFMAMMPEALILREAGPRNSIWDRRLRKTKAAIAAKQALALQDQAIDLMEDQKKQGLTVGRRAIVRLHRLWERMLREDRTISLYLVDAPGNPESSAGWPYYFGNNGHATSTGFFGPMSERMAVGLNHEEPQGGFQEVDPEDDPATE